MWIQFFIAVFCIIVLVLFRNSFAEKELVQLRKEIVDLRKQRNRHSRGSKEWTALHIALKEKENQYKESLGINSLRW